MILLLFGAPFVNAILLIGMYCYVYIYLNRLQVFVRNKQRVTDPFKNMVYDPQICHSLRRDHYFFEVELKCTYKVIQSWRVSPLTTTKR
jgi:hypothetical protein